MVGADGAQLGGELRAAGRLEFVGVQLEFEPVRAARRQDRAASRATVNTPGSQNTSANLASFAVVTAGSISSVRRAMYAARDAALPRDSSGISCAPSHVGTMPHRQLLREARDHAEHLELVVHRESVAGFHLDRGGAVRRQALEARAGERDELILAALRADRAPRRGCRRRAPRSPCSRARRRAAPARRSAGGRRSRACASRRARREHAARAVDARRVGIRPLERLAVAHGDDAVTLHRDGRIGEHAGVAHLGAAPRARRSGAGDHLRRVDEERRARAHAITSRTREIVSGACASPRHA